MMLSLRFVPQFALRIVFGFCVFSAVFVYASAVQAEDVAADAPTASSVTDFVEGDDYEALSRPLRLPANGQVMVMEFFWYGCAHCYSLEPAIQSWLAQRPDDVVFLGVAAPVNPRWEVHAKAFYIAQKLGILRQTHSDLFATIARRPRALDEDHELAVWYTAYGVTEEEYMRLAGSAEIAKSVARALALARFLEVEYVPQFVVGGRYRTSPSMAGGNKEALEVMRFLIDKTRREMRNHSRYKVGMMTPKVR